MGGFFRYFVYFVFFFFMFLLKGAGRGTADPLYDNRPVGGALASEGWNKKGGKKTGQGKIRRGREKRWAYFFLLRGPAENGEPWRAHGE